LARPLIDPPLEFAPVGDGDGIGVGEGDGLGDGLGDGEGEGLCANAGTVCTAISASAIAAVSAADATRLRDNPAIVSARTACLWDRCRHRQLALPQAWHRHIA
jgi:hypothetical protein